MNAPVTVLKVPQTESATPLISEELAHFVGAYATAAIPAAVKARAKHLILDAVGIAATVVLVGVSAAHAWTSFTPSIDPIPVAQS